MPIVPPSGVNLGATGTSQLAAGGGAGPSPGNLLMAAAIQSQDPARSEGNPPQRPRFPAQKLRRRLADPLKGK